MIREENDTNSFVLKFLNPVPEADYLLKDYMITLYSNVSLDSSITDFLPGSRFD